MVSVRDSASLLNESNHVAQPAICLLHSPIFASLPASHPRAAIVISVLNSVSLVYTKLHQIITSREYHHTMCSQFANLASFVFYIHTVIANPISDGSGSERLQESSALVQNNKSWSKEAIITLVGVFAAVSCFIIGLAWPKISRCLGNISGSECFSSSRLQG